MIVNILSDFFGGKSPDVFIHIGAPKTGSSAIQRFCLHNKQHLLSFGYYYPAHGLDNNGISGGHSELSIPLIEGNIVHAESIFRKHLAYAKDKKCALLLSAEGFYGQAEKFSSLLQDLNVKIIGFFRHPAKAFVSNYNQSVKRHYSTKKLVDACYQRVLDKCNPYLDGSYLTEWGDQVGDQNCCFLPYDFQGGADLDPIEHRFIKLLGLSDRHIPVFEYDSARINRSYVPSALELKRMLNLVLEPGQNTVSHQVDWALQKYSDLSNEPDLLLEQQLPAELLQKLFDHFREANELLVRRFSTLSPLVEIDSCYTKVQSVFQQASFDLHAPLNSLFQDYPDIREVLAGRVEALLSNEASRSYSLLRLADLIGVPFTEPPSFAEIMPPNRLKALLNERAELPDALRELAVMMESIDELAKASQLIKRSRQLRPKGPGIISIDERIDQKLSFKQQGKGGES